MNQWRWMGIMGWDSVEQERLLGKIFKSIPSLNASHEGDLSCFQFRESRCCAWTGVENSEGRHSWRKETGICWDSLTQLLEGRRTKLVVCLGRLDVLREQVCPARDMRMVRQKRVQVVSGSVSRLIHTHACVKLSSVFSSKHTSYPSLECEAVTLTLLCSHIHTWEVGPKEERGLCMQKGKLCLVLPLIV